MAALLMVACQKEELHEGPCKVRFVASVQDEVSVTRAETGYTNITKDNAPDFNAALYVSYGTTAPEYTMSWSDSKLSANLWLEAWKDPYWFYGYAPKFETNDVASASFENTTLTLSSIPALTTTDWLVIKPCSTKITTGDVTSGKKTVSLQMDHLMAKITPCFYLNSTYEELRDIRIKKVVFFFEEAPTYTATINYTTSPYTPTWDSDGTNDKCDVEAYSIENSTSADNLPPTKKDNDENPQVYKECGHCYIVPAQSTSTSSRCAGGS